MDEIRRAGAPRLIEWTGERMVPWAPDVQVIYEHLHRYWFAANLAKGRRVLDVGSGEGYGTAILASVADSAVGIELDETTVTHARANYSAANLEYRVGSALDLSAFADDEFGLVVCFEVLEHVAGQEELLAGIARVLGPDGVLLISTPERATYSEDTGQENPFHVRELTESEFRELLGRHFDHLRLWGQRASTGSSIYPTEPGHDTGETIFIEREGDTWDRAGTPMPMYLLAAVSAGELPEMPGQSSLVDPGLGLVRATNDRLTDVYVELGELHRRAGDQIRALEDRERAHRAESRALRESFVEGEARRVHLETWADQLNVALDEARFKVRRMEASVVWRLLERLRGPLIRPDGTRTALGRAVSFALRGVAKVTRLRPARTTRQPQGPDAPVVRFPEYGSVRVSIVIPIHNQAEATLACLQALFAHTERVTYEVILVDDASGPELVALLNRVRGARVLRNDVNQGFVRTANRGISAASGEYVVLLNNDTEVQPGWLSAMVELADSAPDIAAVAAKLLLPDGRIQEAGGIVWSDGGAMHAGRNEHRDEATFNYVRAVDYGSGACLLVRTDVLHDLGALDERYAPAYYEDVDLCFAIRDRGMRVLYQPRAEVIHHEGTSHGTDVETGIKANQVRNADVFYEKWREVLESEQPAPDPEHPRRHADRTRGPQVVVADYRVPARHEDAGSLRMREMLLALRELGCHVTFMPENKIATQPDTHELQQAGIEVLYGPFDERHVISEIGDKLKLAILSRPTVAWRLLLVVREVTPDAHVVYDTVDLHYLREERRSLARGELSPPALIRTFREMEMGLIRSCDDTITVSDEERQAVHAVVPDARITVIPTINRPLDHVSGPEGREGLMFLGGFRHPPNVDCAVHLVQQILPLVRKALGATIPVAIVGSHPTDEVQALAEVEGVEVAGFVENLTPYFQRHRLLAAPLRFGAGVKGKITHSMAAGLPVVTTTIGAEGLTAVNGEHLLVADDDAAFAAAIATLYRDDDLWRRLSSNAQALAQKRFEPQVARDALATILESVTSGSAAAR
jgi:GT2 family glycosyltransferase/SAM-dependent methyltransferase/glycosyltransferase involved in cell wall biosynthesis